MTPQEQRDREKLFQEHEPEIIKIEDKSYIIDGLDFTGIKETPIILTMKEVVTLESQTEPCRDWKCELKNLVIEMRHKEYRESVILSIVVEAFNNA